MVSRLTVGEYFADTGLYASRQNTRSDDRSCTAARRIRNPAVAGYVNSSLWTLKYEVLCYVILAALGVAGLFEERWRKLAIAGLAVLVGTVTLGLPAEAKPTASPTICAISSSSSSAACSPISLAGNSLSTVPCLRLWRVLFVCLAKTPFAEISAALFLGYAALWLATKTLRTAAGRLQQIRRLVRHLHLCRPNAADAAVAHARPAARMAVSPGLRHRPADRLLLVDRDRKTGHEAEIADCRATKEARAGSPLPAT